jgi:hypothetical protein
MSGLTVGQLTAANATTNLISVTSGTSVYSPGSIVQMLNTTLYTPTAVSVADNATSNTNIPDFSCSITPKSASSRIYIQVRWFGELSPQTQNWNTMFGLKRNTTPIGVNPGTAGGATGISMASLGYYASDADSTPEMMFFDYYDSPATTSTLTYQVCCNTTGASMTLYTNRTVTASTASYEYGSSTITLWEIAQ